MAGITFSGNLLGTPEWRQDFGGRDHVLPMPAKLDPSLFTDSLGIVVTASGAAAVGATSIPISALALGQPTATTILATTNVLIPNGTVLSFGSGKFAVLTADALNGATTLTVAAIPTALVSGDTATFSKYGTLYIPSGTLVSRDNPNRTSTALFGPAVSTHSEIYLLYNDIANARINNDCELYRHRGLVVENYLPNYTALTSGTGNNPVLLAAIRANYETIQGVN